MLPLVGPLPNATAARSPPAGAALGGAPTTSSLLTPTGGPRCFAQGRGGCRGRGRTK